MVVSLPVSMNLVRGVGEGGLILIFLLSESQLTWGKAKNANSESYLNSSLQLGPFIRGKI